MFFFLVFTLNIDCWYFEALFKSVPAISVLSKKIKEEKKNIICFNLKTIIFTTCKTSLYIVEECLRNVNPM